MFFEDAFTSLAGFIPRFVIAVVLVASVNGISFMVFFPQQIYY